MAVEETTRISEVTWGLEAAELLLSLGLKGGGEGQCGTRGRKSYSGLLFERAMTFS